MSGDAYTGEMYELLDTLCEGRVRMRAQRGTQAPPQKPRRTGSRVGDDRSARKQPRRYSDTLDVNERRAGRDAR